MSPIRTPSHAAARTDVDAALAVLPGDNLREVVRDLLEIDVREERLGTEAEGKERVRKLVAAEGTGDRFVTKVLGRELGLR